MKKFDQINIWDIGNRINVKVTDNFHEYLNKEIIKKFGYKRKIWQIVNRTYKIPF